MKHMTNNHEASFFFAVIFIIACCGESDAYKDKQESSAAYQVWHNPKIRQWQDYPFFEKPEWTLHKEFWQDFEELPAWVQRGGTIYAYDHFMAGTPAKDIKASGYNIVHVHSPSLERIKEIKQTGLPLIFRMDGRFFHGRDYMLMLLPYVIGFPKEGQISFGQGAWGETLFHHPEHDWHRKFPPSIAATKIRRDGEFLIEYMGSYSARRDLSLMHPVSIQMRDALLREYILGEEIFRAHPGFGGTEGVYWDNPGDGYLPSYDAYSTDYFSREFKKQFGERYRNLLKEWFQKKYPTSENSEVLRWLRELEVWYRDPLRFYILYKDEDVLRWWEELWADAFAGYYAWQYKFLQEEIAPRRTVKHMYVAWNAKFDPYSLYVFSWPTADILGPIETDTIYADKYAPGYKLVLAASNGKPGSTFRGNPVEIAESLACLGAPVIREPSDPYHIFQVTNMDLYHNAKPGARIAVLYHLVDGLHHNEICNIFRVCDQVWRTGVPLEIITERHLSQEVLKNFDIVIVPGFRLMPRDVQGLKAYLEKGGNLILIGDNTDEKGKYLANVLTGIKAWTDCEREVGKGKLLNFSTQLITQEKMTESLVKINGLKDYHIRKPAGENIMLNILRQPEKQLVGIHLVNYTGKVVEGLTLQVPESLNKKHLTFISPHGGACRLSNQGNLITLPKLDVYGVLVSCANPGTQDMIIERNKKEEFKPTKDGILATGALGSVYTNEKKLTDLKPGEKLCHLRQFSSEGLRIIGVDVVTRGAGKANQPQTVTLDFRYAGWDALGEERNYIDKFAFVMRNEETGYRETIPVDMELTEAEKDRLKELKKEVEALKETEGYKKLGPWKQEVACMKILAKGMIMPIATIVRKHAMAQWTPKEPGRYQVYLSHRYVDSIFHGPPDLRETPIYKHVVKHEFIFGDKLQWDDFLYSRPYLKPVYEEKLPGLIVEVE